MNDDVFINIDDDDDEGITYSRRYYDLHRIRKNPNSITTKRRIEKVGVPSKSEIIQNNIDKGNVMNPDSAMRRNIYIENRRIKKAIQINKLDEDLIEKQMLENAQKEYKELVSSVLDKKKKDKKTAAESKNGNGKNDNESSTKK